MNANRRRFIQMTGLSAGIPLLTGLAAAAEAKPRFTKGQSRMKLGTVTYNLGKDWDIETLIKNCEASGFEGAELRTTHAHKVEVDLSAAQRQAVRERFQNSKVELMGLGSAFDYHTPDQNKLKQDIAATKEYIKLAHDVGAGGVKVRPNGLPKEVPVDKTLEQIGRALRELGDFAEGFGVQIRLEVHGTGTSLLPNIRKIIDAADHKNVGVCWNSNDTDLAGEGFDRNFDLVKDKIFTVHMRDLYLEDYPFRSLFARLKETGFSGYCLAEVAETSDPVRMMKYYRAMWLAYQDLL